MWEDLYYNDVCPCTPYTSVVILLGCYVSRRVLVDFWNIEIKHEIGRASITPLVRRAEKRANDRKCTQEKR